MRGHVRICPFVCVCWRVCQYFSHGGFKKLSLNGTKVFFCNKNCTGIKFYLKGLSNCFWEHICLIQWSLLIMSSCKCLFSFSQHVESLFHAAWREVHKHGAFVRFTASQQVSAFAPLTLSASIWCPLLSKPTNERVRLDVESKSSAAILWSVEWSAIRNILSHLWVTVTIKRFDKTSASLHYIPQTFKIRYQSLVILAAHCSVFLTPHTVENSSVEIRFILYTLLQNIHSRCKIQKTVLIL